MALELAWMAPHAPYMPVATAGVLAVLADAGMPATARWDDEGTCLRIESDVDPDGLGSLLAELDWPSFERIRWPGGRFGQGLKPTLKAVEPPTERARAFRDMVAAAPPLEQRLLRAILTDGVLDGEELPGRSRLLRGVKADLSSIFKPPRGLESGALAAELRDGPDFRSGESGYGLGLVPEVQTFGGTTGPDASTVGAYSKLLYVLLWQGIMAFPPLPVRRGWQRVVGGPLVTAPDVLSWPRWRFPVDLDGLRALSSLADVHADRPDSELLRAFGIDAVYRARAVELSSMVAVYRWGERVA
jgi:hypothetical protein